MTSLRAAGVGPIVGHVTDSSARIWIRADPDTDQKSGLDSSTRTIGVIGIIKQNGKECTSPQCYYFRLRREFDRSGTITLGVDPGTLPLHSDTIYEIRIGTLLLDDPIDDELGITWDRLQSRLPAAQAWLEDLKSLPEEASEAVFRTFPALNSGPARFDFLLGSCRYPGLLWKVRDSDRMFAPMAAVTDPNCKSPGIKPAFTLMVGDQIYADMFNRVVPVGKADTYEEFRERYITAFSARNIRNLMRKSPTYMILDDHEIEDNWTQDRLRRNSSHSLFTIAIDAYLSYQWSHSPRTFGKRLYYQFDYGIYPFFVLDTRTQRYLEGKKGVLEDNHMLGRPTLPGSPPGQLLRLLNWLKDMQSQRGDVPKFIVTSSVFVPNPMSARSDCDPIELEKSDSWPGFPETRKAILRCIIENSIQNVIFLAGDIHCSNVATMRFEGSEAAKKIIAHSVTSSAFYWPFPFADGEPSDFVHDSKAKGQEDPFVFDVNDESITMHYKASNFTQEDNFCRLSVDGDKHTLQVRSFDRHGELIIEEDDKGKDYKMDAKLKLHPW